MEPNRQPERQSSIVEKEHLQRIKRNKSGVPSSSQEQHITGAVSVFRPAPGKRRVKRNTRQTLAELLALIENAFASPPGTASFSISSAISDGLPITMAIGKQMLELACKMLHCACAGLALVETETESLHFLAVAGKHCEHEPDWNEGIEGTALTEWLKDAAASAYLKAGESLCIDLTQLPSSQQKEHDICTFFVAPIHLDRQLIAIILLGQNTSHSEYTEEALAIIRAVVSFSALAIERERLQQERAEAQAKELVMRIATQRMDEFLSIVGHEMRSPLTTIKTSIQLAQRHIVTCLQALPGEDTASRERLVEIQHILECAERPVSVQDRLVNDLLEISHIQADRLSFHPTPCNLATILLEAIEDLLTTVPQRLIQSNVSPTDIVPVMADEARIRQVISNYLSNAHQYSPADRPIAAKLTIDREYARIAIRDEGPGLSPEEQGRIWERFYRVQWIERQHSNGVGLGLGLYICQIIIEQHKGQVGVESTPGDGSTFWFTLPLAHPSAAGSELV